MRRNEELHQLLLRATGIEPVWTNDVRANPFGWLRLDTPERLADAAECLAGRARLCTVTAYAEERDDPGARCRIAYHFVAGDTLITITVPVYDPETLETLSVPSITPWFLNADWNEREFMEMFNISITGHPNPKRLFLDERLDAGIMSRLIPFSAMANGAASNTLWERVLEAKGVPVEERMPSLTVPAEPIKARVKATPVSATEPRAPLAAPTLVAVAAPADMARAAGEAAPTEEQPAQQGSAAAVPEGAVKGPAAGKAATFPAGAEQAPDNVGGNGFQADVTSPAGAEQARVKKN